MASEDATTEIETGVRGRSLIVEGWFASHADAGTPGPHLHLRTSDRGPMVLRTEQLPALVEAAQTVAERIERLWDAHGESYTDDVISHADDPNDPEVQRRNQLEDRDFHDKVTAKLPELVEAFRRAESTDEAIDAAILLLGISEGEAFKLARFDLFTITRAAQRRRASQNDNPTTL